MTTANKEELKHRVDARRKQLESRISELKADATRSGSTAMKETKQKLEELNSAAKDGWDNLTDAAAEKINGLLQD